MPTDLERELTAMLESTYREIKAWRSGLNHRDMNKAKVGAVYVPEWFITDLLKKAKAARETKAA